MQGDQLQARKEDPEVGSGPDDLAHRLRFGSSSAGEGAASQGKARVRNRRAHCRAKEAGRAAQASRRASCPGRGPLPFPPPSGTCRARLGGDRPALALRPPTLPPSGWTLLPGLPRRGRQVSEGLRRIAPSPRLPHPWKVPEMTFQPDN